MRVAVGLVSLLALGVAQPALAQKMYKCTDSSGATTFQQAPCALDPKKAAEEAEARAKEQERLKAEKERLAAEEKVRKEENAAKIKARDAAYQEKMKQSAEDIKKTQDAERSILQGTSKEKSAVDGTLPAAVEQTYPAPWRGDANAEIAGAFGQNKTAGCEKFRYRPRAGATTDFVVQCTRDGGANWISYFVWPKSGSVKGPVKF